MFWAINSVTGKRVNSLAIELDASYILKEEDEWYADTNDIESYDEKEVSDVEKIKVTFRKGNDCVVNKFGTQYAISPCWVIVDKAKKGINVVPESKEHKLIKNWIYNKALNKNLSFRVSSVKKPYEYDNKINIAELGIDYNKIGIEVNVTNNRKRIADVIIPLRKYDPLLGHGVVVEIQLSKQFEETTTQRTIDWAIKGYSVCWLWGENIITINDNFIEVKDSAMILEPVCKVLDKFRERVVKDIRAITQEHARLIDLKMDKITEIAEKVLTNKPFVLEGKCPKCGIGQLILKKGRYGDFYGCSAYPGCTHISKIK